MAAPVGNKFAANGTEWKQALRRAMAHKADGDYRKTLDQIAAKVVDQALDGDRECWQEIACREDGKPALNANVTVESTVTVEHLGLPEVRERTARLLGIGSDGAAAASLPH
jgi:hypothetical protein